MRMKVCKKGLHSGRDYCTWTVDCGCLLDSCINAGPKTQAAPTAMNLPHREYRIVLVIVCEGTW